MNESLDLTEILNACSSGDQVSFDVAYRTVIRRVRAIASALKRQADNSIETHELADDAMLKIMNGTATKVFDNREKFFSYACTVIVNLLRDDNKRKNAQKRIPGHAITPLQFVSESKYVNSARQCDVDILLDLLAWLENISPIIAKVFRYQLVLEWSREEIASHLDLTPEKVDSIRAAGVALVRKYFQ